MRILIFLSFFRAAYFKICITQIMIELQFALSSHFCYFKGIFIVENVVPWYDPLIEGVKIGRHIFWSNIDLTNIKYVLKPSHELNIKNMQDFKGFDLSPYKNINKRMLLRNCVDYRLSIQIFNEVFSQINKKSN